MNFILRMIATIPAALVAIVGTNKDSRAVSDADTVEGAAWERAIDEGTADAMQDFIAQFPASQHTLNAMDRLVQAELAEARPKSWKLPTRFLEELADEGGGGGPY